MKKEKRIVTLFYNPNGKPLRAEKQDRNAPCKCGSGKKAKKCCGSTTAYKY